MNTIKQYYTSPDYLFLKVNDDNNLIKKTITLADTTNQFFGINDTFEGKITKIQRFKDKYYNVAINVNNTELYFITRNNTYTIGQTIIGQYIVRDIYTSTKESVIIFKDITNSTKGGDIKKLSKIKSKKLSKIKPKKSPKIHTGPRGGKYIIKKGKKIYQ